MASRSRAAILSGLVLLSVAPASAQETPASLLAAAQAAVAADDYPKATEQLSKAAAAL